MGNSTESDYSCNHTQLPGSVVRQYSCCSLGQITISVQFVLFFFFFFFFPQQLLANNVAEAEAAEAEAEEAEEAAKEEARHVAKAGEVAEALGVEEGVAKVVVEEAVETDRIDNKNLWKDN